MEHRISFEKKGNIQHFLPIIVLGAAAILLYNILKTEELPKKRKRIKKYKRQKKVFISFAYKDKKYRDFLVAQGKNTMSPFSFTDMSVKEPWENYIWKEKCRDKIKRCDGVIALLSKNTWHSSGSRWEMKCAKEEGVSIVGMHIKKQKNLTKPPELSGKKVINWKWDDLHYAINNF